MERLVLIPISLNQGKKTQFFSEFRQNYKIPIKYLKRNIGKKHYYAFFKQISEINRILQKINPQIQPPFSIYWERDSVTGREIKVIERSSNVRLYQSEADMVLMQVE